MGKRWIVRPACKGGVREEGSESQGIDGERKKGKQVPEEDPFTTRRTIIEKKGPGLETRP